MNTDGGKTAGDKRYKTAWQTTGLEYLSLIAVMAALVVVFGIIEPRFFSKATFLQVANDVPAVVIIAVGMTYVLIISGIDLSVGSVLGFSAALLGTILTRYHLPLLPAILCAILAGALCGLINGLVSVRWQLPSFIVTLGMLEIARGATHMVTQSRTVYIGGKIGAIASTHILGLSVPAILAILIVIIGQIVLSKTVFGRYMVAVGTNEEAVRLSGVDPRPVKIGVFTIIGLLSAVAAVIETSRLEASDPNAGNGLELQVIAAVVIGGTSLMGGKGSVVRSFFGVLIIAILGAGLIAIGVRDETKRLITGVVIVAAVILDYYRRRLGRKSAGFGKE
ncbi:MAG: ABC transporter permease [Kiritimatiellae bacterium]|nr:ABC transporter permease [Kiritimatiellia bacterium]MDD5519238.1 ABC transporter permease [Kiritimatiellia bacterium]